MSRAIIEIRGFSRGGKREGSRVVSHYEQELG
jgi:hypothetical protein